MLCNKRHRSTTKQHRSRLESKRRHIQVSRHQSEIIVLISTTSIRLKWFSTYRRQFLWDCCSVGFHISCLLLFRRVLLPKLREKLNLRGWLNLAKVKPKSDNSAKISFSFNIAFLLSYTICNAYLHYLIYMYFEIFFIIRCYLFIKQEICLFLHISLRAVRPGVLKLLILRRSVEFWRLYFWGAP